MYWSLGPQLPLIMHNPPPVPGGDNTWLSEKVQIRLPKCILLQRADVKSKTNTPLKNKQTKKKNKTKKTKNGSVKPTKKPLTRKL